MSGASHAIFHATPLVGHATPLVGRDHEQGILRAHLDAALDGRGSLVLIGGEAGIGKTALAEALLAEAAGRGALVLVGRCYDLAETPPYGLWAEALEQAAHAAGSPPPPELAAAGIASQAVLFAIVRDYLAALAATRPLVLLLDDLHWADPASHDLLRVVARGLADLPAFLLATYRADELAADHPLAALLPLIVREARAAQLDLRPLDVDAIGMLVAARYTLGEADRERLVGYLAERTEGNALFLGELLRTLEHEGLLRREGDGWLLGDLDAVPVPPLLQQVIAGRVARLGPEAVRVLAVAAVVGQVVPLAHWAAVVGVDEEALADAVGRAVEARVLTETPGGAGVRFAHALVRETLYEAIPLPRRRGLHRRAAEALLAVPHLDPDAVAGHLQRAGDPRAIEWLIRAGERAWRAYAWLVAADRYEAALVHMAGREELVRERAVLLMSLAQLRRYDNAKRSGTYLEEAARLAAMAGDRVLVAAARFDRGHLRCLGGERGRGLEEMAEAVPVLDALLPAERRLLPTVALLGATPEERYHRGALAVQLARVGRIREAWELGRVMINRGPGTTARGLAGLGLIYAYRGEPGLSRRAFADARVAYQTAGQHLEAAITFEWKCSS